MSHLIHLFFIHSFVFSFLISTHLFLPTVTATTATHVPLVDGTPPFPLSFPSNTLRLISLYFALRYNHLIHSAIPTFFLYYLHVYAHTTSAATYMMQVDLVPSIPPFLSIFPHSLILFSFLLSFPSFNPTQFPTHYRRLSSSFLFSSLLFFTHEESLSFPKVPLSLRLF